MVLLQQGPGLRQEDGYFPGYHMYPQLCSRSPGLQHGAAWSLQLGYSWRAWVQGCVKLASKAASTWSLHGAPGSQAEHRTLSWGAGPAPCQLWACSGSLSKGSQGSLLNRLSCTVCSRFPWHHTLPGHMASSPAMFQGSGAAVCQGSWTQDAAAPHLPGSWEVCANMLCASPAGHLTFARCYGRPPWLLPPLCHLPALPLQLPVDHHQEGEEEGLENHQGDTTGDAEMRLARPCMGGLDLWLGWRRVLAGRLSPDIGLLTPCHWSCSPGLSPKRAGVLPGTLSVQRLP